MAKLTPAQFRALDQARGDSVSGNARTIRSLYALGYLKSVEGWYEKSMARRVGRLYATTRCWGTVAHHITDAGKKALADAKAAREWKRIEPGHLVRYASDGTTIQARIVREPELRAGGLLGPDRWTAWILPSHGGWNASRPGLRTIKDAQAWIERALPEAEAEIAAERAAEQLIEQIVCGDGGDEMGCADCAVAPEARDT